ncbi:MAG: lipase family protein [Micrococcales bacterium]
MSKVTADQDELTRIANNLSMAKLLLEGDLLLNLVTHPARNALIEIQLLDLIYQVDELYRDCTQVQHNLFATETTLDQNHKFLTADLMQNLAQVSALAFTAVGTTANIKAQPAFTSSVSSNHFEALVQRLQSTALGDVARVRIDLNQSQGYRQFTIYIPGIQNLGIPNRNPFDLASSVAEFTGKHNSAEQAVKLAIQQSQIGRYPTDRVILVGHSLGGLIVNRLSNDPNLKVNGVVTFGSPNDQIDVPESIPTLNLTHIDDPITRLDGIVGSGQRLGSDVQFDNSSIAPESDKGVIHSHDLSSYQKTAAQLDFSQDQKLDAIKDVLHTALGDGELKVQYYEIRR